MSGSNPLQRYQSEFSDIPGFFGLDSMMIWGFLFGAQQRLGVGGDFLEIGVFRGKSAVLGALYMRPQERAVFVDLGIPAEVRQLIQRAKPENNIFLERRSHGVLNDQALRDSMGTMRWCHIDGDHTGYSTLEDLYTAANLLNERGIICVDDFFNFRYPQLTAVVYEFLRDNASRFRMLFCGANKCYICRASVYVCYERDIRENLLKNVRQHELKLQVYKTSFASDSGCFSLGLLGDDRPMYGMDDNPDFIPF